MYPVLLRLTTLGLGFLLIAPEGKANEAVERLIDRVPPSASLAIIADDFSSQLASIRSSELSRRWLDSQSLREWAEFEGIQQLLLVRKEIERALDVEVGEIVESLLGEAVVLTLHLPPDGRSDQARGLLQTRVNDSSLLKRLIDASNEAERTAGKLKSIQRKIHAGVRYQLREFNDGRPSEGFVLLNDETFVWTNSERLIKDVLERHANERLPALSDEPTFISLRAALPGESFLQVLVDPKFVGKMIAEDENGIDPGDLPEPVVRIIRAINGVGLAIDWQDGPLVHLVEVLDPDRLPTWLDTTTTDASRPSVDRLERLIPASSVALAAGYTDFGLLFETMKGLVPPSDRPRFRYLELVLEGVSLGLDLRTEILPMLGPEWIVALVAPSEDKNLDSVYLLFQVVVKDPRTAKAIENAIQTILAFIMLSDERGKPDLIIEPTEIGEIKLTRLASPFFSQVELLAFGTANNIFAIATHAATLADSLRGASESIAEDGGSNNRSQILDDRSDYFDDAFNFIYVDLSILQRLDEDARLALAQRITSVDEDLDTTVNELNGLLDLLRPFRAAYATSTVAKESTVVAQRVGLIINKE